ncbi:hypothetical protein M413DRAFT_22102 [Hebeloma cylindrosporum]|uniref:Uncharacterized protein n=1 Tax=Hebeloma cylindrosporum TaxID=76867 RepID=A0A0C3CU61_HEBCY|nr:hypothetical protein M413DRAFT_22102 [Hebeloma cylindrosporum h7]
MTPGREAQNKSVSPAKDDHEVTFGIADVFSLLGEVSVRLQPLEDTLGINVLDFFNSKFCPVASSKHRSQKLSCVKK